MDDLFKDLLHIQPCLGGNARRMFTVKPDHILNLRCHPVRVGAWKIDLIDHGKDLQIVVKGKVHIPQRLGFDPLSRIHDQHRAVAGRKGAGDLIVKVHMARGVNQVQDVFFPIFGLVNDPYGL